jgi:glycosyltransferase involved in cell wall biosynthesis
MRPYLWGSKISVVPIRIGGGTRLKIYECMAAGTPVVSTSVGAEGLRYEDGADMTIADDPRSFSAACVRLLTDDAARRSIANKALQRAQSELSWEAVSREFEAILDNNRLPPT